MVKQTVRRRKSESDKQFKYRLERAFNKAHNLWLKATFQGKWKDALTYLGRSHRYSVKLRQMDAAA